MNESSQSPNIDQELFFEKKSQAYEKLINDWIDTVHKDFRPLVINDKRIRAIFSKVNQAITAITELQLAKTSGARNLINEYYEVIEEYRKKFRRLSYKISKPTPKFILETAILGSNPELVRKYFNDLGES